MAESHLPRAAGMNGAFKGRGRNYVSLLVCPVDGAALAHQGGGMVCTRQPAHAYPFEDGILRLAPLEQRRDLDAISAAYDAQCAAQGWDTPDEAAFKSLPQTGLGGYPEQYWARQAESTALLWLFLELIRHRNGDLPVGPMGEAAVIGAGTGWLAYGLDVAGFTTVALDRRVGAQHGLGVYPIARYLRVQADLVPPPLAAGAFDLIVFQDGLAHLGDDDAQQATITHAARALRPGGVVAVLNALAVPPGWFTAAQTRLDHAGLLPVARPRRRGWRALLDDLRERVTGRDPAPPVIVVQKPV